MNNWLCSCLMLLLIAPVVIAAEEAKEADEPDTELTPEECINVRQIKKTEIIDDQNIVFYMSGGKIYRNHLPRKCFGLKRRESFSYKIRTSRLCGIDSIRVVDQFGGGIEQGPSCGLGKFFPISEAEVAFLMGDEPRPEQPEPVDDDE